MNERRREKRALLQTEVTARTRSTSTVRILDISTSGMGVQCTEPLPPNKNIVVWIPTTAGDLKLRANVKRCRLEMAPSGNGNGKSLVYRAGLEFCDVDDSIRKTLAETYLEPTSVAVPSGPVTATVGFFASNSA